MQKRMIYAAAGIAGYGLIGCGQHGRICTVDSVNVPIRHTTTVRLRTPANYIDEPELADHLGTLQIMQAQNDAHTRILVSRTEKTDAPEHASLNNYVAFVNTTFSSAYPDREFQLVEVNAEPNVLADRGLPFVAAAWPHRVESGDPLAICESAALIFDTGDAFWTLSWNAPNGALLEDLDVLDLMLEHLDIK